jgi:penicillin-binding protein 2
MIKPIVALAAAACGVGPERTFSCVGKPRGTLEVAGRVFRCDGEHGAVNMERAVSQSCNLYFWEVSRRIGPEAIFTWARDLGFGRLTGVDLPYEWKGRLPDPSRAPRWYVGNTLNLAVGQENLSVTPLQVAVVMAAIANGGKVIRPTVLHRIEPEPDPETFPSPCSPVIAELPLPPAGLRAVRAGMLDAALSGTASRVEGIRSLRAAVKTGTAQTTNEQINQAWIGGYLPADAPRYAFVVVVHNVPGHGADVAGPIAVAVLNTLLRDRPSLAP